MPIADSNFLIPNSTFIVELVAFLIVLAIVGKYVLPPLKKALDDRAALISSELTAAGEAKAEASAADDDRKSALEEARHQAREIVAQANRTAEQVKIDAQTNGQSEYERIVSNAQTEVGLARQRAIEEAANRMGQIVMDVVERVIGREVNADSHRDLIDEAVSALRADAAGGAAASSGARQ
ncbi:MAG TPA: F0F1 ATP synthase subunit B [Acidimicrobiales bacterium]|jgi:F-type H+-transporting ATPase subunit b|nr:F0F1 ATP synthase subunit B [Acidimicrobiales bacterium]